MSKVTNLSLGQAVASQDLEAVTAVVSAAVAKYGHAEPAVPSVDTVFGSMPLTSIYDVETKWAQINMAYADIVQRAQHIPTTLDREIEIAKLIAANATLRHITTSAPSADGLL